MKIGRKERERERDKGTKAKGEETIYPYQIV